MATFSAVTRQHILQAIAEYDSRGRDDFLGVYGYDQSVGYTLEHDGRTYDPAAVLGVAHRYATGRLAPSHEFSDGLAGATAILRKRGFDVTEPASARPAVVAPARRAPAARKTAAATRPSTRTTTRAAAPERPVAMCPTCSMVLPATGICDYCS